MGLIAAAALCCASGTARLWAEQAMLDPPPVSINGQFLDPVDVWDRSDRLPVPLGEGRGEGNLRSAFPHPDAPPKGEGSFWTGFEGESPAEHGALLLAPAASGDQHNTVAHRVAPAKFLQQDAGDQVRQPSYLDSDHEADVSRPSYLESGNEAWSVADELQQLSQRLEDLEAKQTAQEDATRTIIRRSFAERGSNITDSVVFGGTLEVLTFWDEDFDGVTESDIILDTAELDFEIQVNSWTLGSLVLEYFDGTNFLFQSAEEDAVFVDRVNVRQAWITIGDTANYPLYATLGRDVVPFGISTGDPVADVLTIIDPLTVEVFETSEDFIMLGFAGPTCCPPPAAPNPVPPPPQVRPVLINPLVRRAATCLVSYCPCTRPVPPAPPAAPLPTCTPPFSGAIYFYNGDTNDGGGDHIEHIGGTLGYFHKGTLPYRCVPWSLDVDVDVNSSVFDSDFLQFEYRRFLDQIGYVPGMAAHVKSTAGPIALVVEWNGAINDATFRDDLDTQVTIRPSAWQISLAYQFDWNRYVEVIGAQGTYFAISYSQSNDLAGVTRVLGVAPDEVQDRVGFVPEKRLSVGVGEWVLDGLRVAIEYSYIWDYSPDDGGTGESANGVFAQLTYEW